MSGIRPLSETLAQIAKNELNETPELVEITLKALKKWLLNSSHLNACTDDQFLMAFLRGCKFRLDKAKAKLDTYYTMQTTIPEMNEPRDPMDPKTSFLLKQGLVGSFE
jgi:hypothetical protein